ncbi:MAG TPA: LysM domain-containing protein, partial [Rhodanobacteraceae bacterium]|nr:LysM domain-containing protein [Rhodanobacteraceae bacterium]
MLKKSLAVLAGVMMTLAAYAATTALRPGHPDTYVVKQGDTLWDISARFLSKPWLWPEIWQANPQVHNPHLIYPGDVLNLGYDAVHGPTLHLQPRVRSGAAPVPAIPLSALKMFLKDLRVMDSGALARTPYVVGFEEDQLRGAPGQFIYVRNLNATPGQRWAVVRPTHIFRQYNNDVSKAYPDKPMDEVAHELDDNVELWSGPWHENTRGDGHLGKGVAELGTEVTVIGTAEVLRGGDPASLLLTDSTREIRKGDRLLPVDDKPYDAYYYPHAPHVLPPRAHVIALTGALAAAGKRQIVALSAGAADGIDDGTTFSVLQPGDRIHDDVSGDSMRRGVGDHVRLPDEFVGHVMVFRTF